MMFAPGLLINQQDRPAPLDVLERVL